MAATDMHTTTEEMLEAVFSVRSVPRLYNEGQLPLEKSLETAVRRRGGKCGTVTRWQECEHISRGHCWIHHQAMTGEDTD
jgi:hypothetical protein